MPEEIETTDAKPVPADVAPRGRCRIAFCHYTADIGGGSDRALFDLVTHLPLDRFHPAMILRVGDPMARAYRDAGIEVVQVPLVPPRRALEWAKLARFFLAYWPSVFRVAQVIRALQADVVHVNTLFNLQGAVAARLARRPLVWHVRELVPESRLVSLLLRLVSVVATRAVAISSAVGDSLDGCGDRRRTVFDGIDPALYDGLDPDGADLRAELGLAPDRPIVVTVGRLEPWKGQHVLVEAIPDILADHSDAVLLFVGAPAVNKPGYADALADRCQALGVTGSVRFTGMRHDVPAILAAANVLVLPSVTPEPFGLTVIEAMAARCPVVATAAGGPLDTVTDGDTGYLVPANDPHAIAERVCRVLADPDGARAIGERGRERVARLFSLDRVVREMGDLFMEVRTAKR